MSIRDLARELYRAQRSVEQLEKKLAASSPKQLKEVEDELRQARAELTTLRKIMSGEKESGSFRKKFDGFGS